MKMHPPRAVLAAALTTCAVAGALAPSPASASYATASCANALKGCQTTGFVLWNSVSTARASGTTAPQLCARMFSSAGTQLIATPCSSNVSLVVRCYYGSTASYGQFSGSSNFAINGKAANGSDTEFCP